MKRYEKYKPSGVEWLGEIPEGWEVKRVKDYTYLKARIGWQGLRSDEFIESTDWYCVTGTDFNNGTIDWANCYCVEKNRFDQDINIHLKLNDLLITKDGTIGKIALITELPKKATLNSGVFVTRPQKNKYSNNFMFWLLSSSVFTKFINYNKNGSTILHLYQNVFEKFSYCLPNDSEQTAIANYLDTQTALIDKKINLLNQKIKIYQELRKSLINETVCRGLRNNKLVELVETKESGIEWIGKIPKHWEIKRIKDIFSSLAGGTPSTKEKEYWVGEIPWIPSGKVQNNIIVPKIVEDFISEKALKESSTKMAKSNSILIALTGATCSNIGYLTFDTTINQSIVAILPRQKIDMKYYFNFLMSSREKIRTFMTGGAQGGINQEDIKFLKILFPPLSEQTAIATYLDEKTQKIDRIINNLKGQIEKLKELRKTLINEVVTGKIKVTP